MNEHLTKNFYRYCGFSTLWEKVNGMILIIVKKTALFHLNDVIAAGLLNMYQNQQGNKGLMYPLGCCGMQNAYVIKAVR